MSDQLVLSSRDEEILEALVVKVRVFALRQIADHWWKGDLANARRRLRQLTKTGLLKRVELQVRPLPKLTKPVLIWQPGDIVPNFDAVAYYCQRRWHAQPVRT
jgi:hypothetical protein